LSRAENAPYFERMKILIYDMEATDAHRLGRVLRRLDHEVLIANECETALARIEEAKVNVVIGDGRIPRFAWIDLCRQLRGDRAKPYVYFLLLESSWADESHEDWAYSAGVDDFLHALADERELRRRLRLAAHHLTANQRVQQLESVVPVCGHCKKIRDEFDRWQGVESYLGTRLGKQLSPSICPDCYIKNFGLEFRNHRIPQGAPVDLDQADA
jgi:sigma-B regulation protein RsbU (phosphoserine phosphatase)